MLMSILSSLIASKTRINILMRLFLNPKEQVYLRELANELSISPSQASGELQQLRDAGFLKSSKSGRQINYHANTEHPLFPELQSMVRKSLGMDKILESIIERLGNLNRAFLIDDYAQGKDSGLIDLVLIGDIDRINLGDLVTKTEKYIGRKIRTLVLSTKEYKEKKNIFEGRALLLLWEE
jgi:DNA-binding transcriptional ArsR family regulator